jgi:addiction module HigA family antidote
VGGCVTSWLTIGMVGNSPWRGGASGPTCHPGALLREYVLPGLALSVSQAAKDLGVSRQTLHRILDGSASVTAEMATRLETLTGMSSMFWLRLQCAHDVERARASLAGVLSTIPRHTLPRKIMKQIGALDER